MKIAVACDHGGLALKALLVQALKEAGCQVLDLGAHQYDQTDDYPTPNTRTPRNSANEDAAHWGKM